MKSFKQHLNEETLNQLFEMSDEQFDDLLENLTDEELAQLEEGVLGAIGRGVAAVAKGAAKVAKKAAFNDKGNFRLSTAGRADGAEKKLAKIQKKRADRERIKKAQAAIDKEKAAMRAKNEREKATENVVQKKKSVAEEKKSIEETVLDVARATQKQIQEDGYSQVTTADGTDLAHNDVKNAEVLEMLNAHIGQIGVREYMNPKGALLQLQGKLATIGLSFDIPAMTEQKGTATAPLTQFGGVFGKSVTTPTDEFDNENPAEGLNIQFEYEKLKTGLTKVYAKIV